ncbi:MAG: glycosyltransferase family 4 protein, partial [Methanomicrobiales archaeon]|nr:glycosyltransferase family 4 protein [Methanomicrobiales archaeon]
MKIALTCGMDFSRPNGVTRYIEAVASGLARHQEVHLLSSEEPPLEMPVTVHRTPLMRFPWMRCEPKTRWIRSILNVVQLTTRLFFNAVYFQSLYRRLRKYNHVDIFHSQSLDSPVADVVTMHACYAAAWNKKRMSIHDISLSAILGYILFLPFNWGSLAIERSILHRSQLIMAVSPQVKQEIMEIYHIRKDKIAVVPNGVDMHRFKPDPEKRRLLRQRYGISVGETVLIFVGNLFKVKGLDCVLEAIGSLDGVRLFVIGDDVHLSTYLRRTQKSGLGERVIFTGKVTTGIENYYAASDIFVLPSESEGFPLSALEAGASALPLLTTRIGGLQEFVEDGKNGFFIQRQARDIADRVKQMVSDPTLIITMGASARMKAERYSWEIVVEKTLNGYRLIMGEKLPDI